MSITAAVWPIAIRTWPTSTTAAAMRRRRKREKISVAAPTPDARISRQWTAASSTTASGTRTTARAKISVPGARPGVARPGVVTADVATLAVVTAHEGMSAVVTAGEGMLAAVTPAAPTSRERIRRAIGCRTLIVAPVQRGVATLAARNIAPLEHTTGRVVAVSPE